MLIGKTSRGHNTLYVTKQVHCLSVYISSTNKIGSSLFIFILLVSCLVTVHVVYNKHTGTYSFTMTTVVKGSASTGHIALKVTKQIY